MNGVGGARPPKREAKEPLWAQVLADLRRRLADGEFADAFPGEHALVEEYRVSRHTVRESLRRLRGEGVVTANRGRRPRVVGPDEIEQPVGVLYSLFNSVEAAGLEQRSVVRTLDVRADGVIAARLGLEESTPLVYLERLRMAGSAPLALDRVWLPEHLAAPLLEVDFRHTALYDEYARRCGVRVTGGQEHIRAVLPYPGERWLLDLAPDAAAFAIERLGCSRGQPVEWRHTVVRGDRFVITANLAPNDAYRLGLTPRS
ncbi:GntR family transcriptional regulator [Pseudonocardia eucalypti]|uniref:GntR family transcriptional regulator n=1 Tax=Pseudonocardia eucalypti TaxID=648755 RepID=A0ABP9QNX5_9PSEU|nr:GntR family transcriptional regulator [Pseudonocardia eucalypti]